MRMAAHYSHLNGLEWLQQNHPTYWTEIQQTIASVNAPLCKTKISREKTMAGKMLFSPMDLNKAFRKELRARGWRKPPRAHYYVTDDEKVTREIIGIPVAEQKARIEASGRTPIRTFNEADFRKGRVSVEVQFGKYSFVQFDVFIKHAAAYMHNEIDLGIEIVPMKTMEDEMSSGPPYYEKHLHEIIRQGRIFPPVPLVLIGVTP
jgi:hypothetical protein